MRVHHILHLFFLVIPSALSLWSFKSPHRDPLRTGDEDEEREECSRARNNLKRSRSVQIDEGRCWQWAQASEAKFEMVGNVETFLKDFPLVSPIEVASVTDMTGEKFLRQAEVQRVTSISSIPVTPSPSSLLLAVSEHLLPLQDHFIQFLQAGLQTLTIQRWASLCVVQCGWTQFMEGQHLFYLKHRNTRQEVCHNLTLILANLITFKPFKWRTYLSILEWMTADLNWFTWCIMTQNRFCYFLISDLKAWFPAH